MRLAEDAPICPASTERFLHEHIIDRSKETGMTKGEYRCLKRQMEDRVLIITLDNPPDNYLSSIVFGELDACKEWMLSDDVDAVVFTGRGRVFSKGADLSELRDKASSIDRRAVRLGNDILTFISELRKPVIGAINGACLGGGLELALACHMRLCSEKAFLGLPELSVGLIPGLGGVERLIRTVGEPKALEMILLGDIVPAQRAMEIGLVNRLYPKADFMPKVMSFVRTILMAPRDAIESILGLALRARAKDLRDNTEAAADRFADLMKGRRP